MTPFVIALITFFAFLRDVRSAKCMSFQVEFEFCGPVAKCVAFRPRAQIGTGSCDGFLSRAAKRLDIGVSSITSFGIYRASKIDNSTTICTRGADKSFATAANNKLLESVTYRVCGPGASTTTTEPATAATDLNKTTVATDPATKPTKKPTKTTEPTDDTDDATKPTKTTEPTDDTANATKPTKKPTKTTEPADDTDDTTEPTTKKPTKTTEPANAATEPTKTTIATDPAKQRTKTTEPANAATKHTTWPHIEVSFIFKSPKAKDKLLVSFGKLFAARFPDMYVSVHIKEGSKSARRLQLSSKQYVVVVTIKGDPGPLRNFIRDRSEEALKKYGLCVSGVPCTMSLIGTTKSTKKPTKTTTEPTSYYNAATEPTDPATKPIKTTEPANAATKPTKLTTFADTTVPGGANAAATSAANNRGSAIVAGFSIVGSILVIVAIVWIYIVVLKHRQKLEGTNSASSSVVPANNEAAADPSTEITMPKLMAPKESVYQMHVGDETKTEQNTFERAQQIETKHELEMKLTGPQALFQTELMEEMEATQRDIKRLQENISGAKTEQEKAAFATQLVDRQRQLDQIRADFETSNSDFEKGLQAEAARKSELLKKRRAAAKAKREAVAKLHEQAAQETDAAKKEELQQELTAEQLELENLEDTVKQTEQEKEAFDTQLADRQRKLDQIRANFDKNNSDFEKGLQAEAARKSELLEKRRAAAKAKREAVAKLHEQAAQETDAAKKEELQQAVAAEQLELENMENTVKQIEADFHQHENERQDKLEEEKLQRKEKLRLRREKLQRKKEHMRAKKESLERKKKEIEAQKAKAAEIADELERQKAEESIKSQQAAAREQELKMAQKEARIAKEMQDNQDQLHQIEQTFKARDAKANDALSAEKHKHKDQLAKRMAARRKRHKHKHGQQKAKHAADASDFGARESKLREDESKLRERESKMLERENALEKEAKRLMALEKRLNAKSKMVGLAKNMRSQQMQKKQAELKEIEDNNNREAARLLGLAQNHEEEQKKIELMRFQLDKLEQEAANETDMAKKNRLTNRINHMASERQNAEQKVKRMEEEYKNSLEAHEIQMKAEEQRRAEKLRQRRARLKSQRANKHGKRVNTLVEEVDMSIPITPPAVNT